MYSTKNCAKNKLLTLLLILAVFLLSAAAIAGRPVSGRASALGISASPLGADSGADGTAQNPYRIQSAEDLKFFAQQVNEGNAGYNSAHYILECDISLNNTDNWQNWNVIIPAVEWAPIGNSNNRFSGVFDGGGNTISGVYINSVENQQGFFGYIDGGIVKNFGVEKSYLRGGNDVGGIVGYLRKGTIDNCHNTGTVVSNSDSLSNVGGIIGQMLSQGTVVNSRNAGNVVMQGTNSGYAGGIAGQSYGKVLNSYNEGTVSNTKIAAFFIVSGGIVGYNTSVGIMENCYNSGDINGGTVGGAVGFNESANGVNFCYTKSKIGDNSSNIKSKFAVTGYFNSDSPEVYGVITTALLDALNAWMANPVDLPEGTSYRLWCNTALPYFVQKGVAGDAVWDGQTAEMFENLEDPDIGTSADNPFVISSAAQLKYFAILISSNFECDRFNNNGAYYRLDCDVRLNNTAGWEGWNADSVLNRWEGIGNNVNKFLGVFDGGGNTVSGVCIRKTGDMGSDYQGLFGVAGSGSKISNISVEKSYITARNYVGGIAGKAESGSIISNASVKPSNITATTYVGGIAGAFEGGRIENCTSSATVKSNHTATNYAGGIAGNANGGTILDCHNSGAVTGDYSGTVGGITGSATSATISECSNSGTVSGNATAVGGIVGSTGATTTISKCYNTGNVTSASTSQNYVGGIVGNATSCTVSDSYNTGFISGTIAGSAHVGSSGGIAGHLATAGSSITNCFNTGSIYSETKGGNSNAGGIVGNNAAECNVTNCYSTGMVTSKKDTATGSSGGIAGDNAGTVKYCYFLKTSVHNPTLNVAGADTGTSTNCAVFDESCNLAPAVTVEGEDCTTALSALNAWVVHNNTQPKSHMLLEQTGEPVGGGALIYSFVSGSNTPPYVPNYMLTIEYNNGDSNGTHTIREGTVLSEYEPRGFNDKEGQTFTGWYTYDGDEEVVVDWETAIMTGDLTVYAKWTEIPPTEYTLTIEYNNGDNNGTHTIREGTVLSEYEPRGFNDKEGHTFAGWHTHDGDEEVVFDWETTTMTGDLTVYARWSPIVHEVEIYIGDNGGAQLEITGENAQELLDSSSYDIQDGKQITLTALPEDGYRLKNWTIQIGDSQIETFTTVQITVTITSDTIITVTFEENIVNYTVEYWFEDIKIGDGDPRYSKNSDYTEQEQGIAGTEADIAEHTEKQITGFEYSRETSSTGETLEISDGMIIRIYFSRNTYTVDFCYENNDQITQKTYQYQQALGSFPQAVPPADNAQYTYSFEGWYKDGAKVTINHFVTENQTIIVKYTATPKQYTITFNKHDGTLWYAATAHYGDVIVLPPANPTRDGDAQNTYEFDGWQGYTDGDEVTGNHTFVAKFKQISKNEPDNQAKQQLQDRISALPDAADLAQMTQAQLTALSQEIDDIKQQAEAQGITLDADMQWMLQQIYNATNAEITLRANNQNKQDDKPKSPDKTKIIIAVIAGSAVLSMAAAATIIIKKRRKKQP